MKTADRNTRGKKNGETELPENKRKNGYRKSSYISNHPKCKWTKLTNKMAQNSELDQKAKPNATTTNIDSKW